MILKKVIFPLTLILLISLVIIQEHTRERPSEPLQEGCLFCHDQVEDPDPVHPVSAFGCYKCHLGNRHSLEKERAHVSMVKNPGDLRVVDRTCGRSGCHADIVPRVKQSVMATNRGILEKIQFNWIGLRDTHTGVRELLEETRPRNIAVGYYRKLCGGCHLWKKRGEGRGEVARRGGGCSDCHILDKEEKDVNGEKVTKHPRLTLNIPSENCVKCHNRSARIGLSYFGKYESAGYGTPYQEGGLDERRLSGNRFFLHLAGDIHSREGGMECIDCHTDSGVMGEGKRYEDMSEQVDITCRACHSPRFMRVSDRESKAYRLASLNNQVPDTLGRMIGVSKKGTPLYNLQKWGGKVYLFRKKDGRALSMDMDSGDRPYHNLKGHERLSCQSCHSPWVPQCYGCHITYRKGESQWDWISGRITKGRWEEKRSYLRFSSPALGVRKDSKVFPLSPCQVFVSVFDESGGYEGDLSFRYFTVSAFDPHTTSKGSRTCRDCHADPKTLGLGEGRLYRSSGRLRFRPTYEPGSSGMGIQFPLDGLVDTKGDPLQVDTFKGIRSFNKKELERIYSVAPCLGCHQEYDDPIYEDFQASLRRFRRGEDLPCAR